MVTDFAVRLDSQRASCWRSVLAALISFALVLSFFHGWSPDSGNCMTTVAVAQASCDAAGEVAPDKGASPHGDHCLAHVTTIAPQDNAWKAKRRSVLRSVRSLRCCHGIDSAGRRFDG